MTINQYQAQRQCQHLKTIVIVLYGRTSTPRIQPIQRTFLTLYVMRLRTVHPHA